MKDESSGVVSGIANAGEEQGGHAMASTNNSGIANLGAKQTREQVKPTRPLPVPPRPAADITRQRVARFAVPEPVEPPITGTRSKPAPNEQSSNVRERTTSPPPAKQRHMDSDSDGSSSRDSERTTIFRPNLKDPKLRTSLAPTAPPAPLAKATAISAAPTPTPAPQAKTAIETEIEEQEEAVGSESWEEHTHAYAPEVIDKLLNVERPTIRPNSCAADEATRVGELPIEALVLAQQKASNKGIGFDDETGVYSLVTGTERADATSPGTRPKIAAPGLPSIVIRDELPSRRRVPWLAIAGCVAALSMGWFYRGGIGAEFHKVQSKLVRGLEGAKPVAIRPAPAPAPAVVTIAISVSPADARLLLDDAPVTNPCSIQRRADTQPHTLVAAANGFAPLHRTVHFESDLTIVLALAPLAAAAAPVSPPAIAPSSAPILHDSPRLGGARSVRGSTAKAKRVEPASVVQEAAPRSDCDPPYTLDEAGIKVYKTGCL